MKLFKGQIELNGEYTLKVNDDGLEVFHKKGDYAYFENNGGYWSKFEYDEEGKIVYFENSDGVVQDNRPKVSVPQHQLEAIAYIKENFKEEEE